jgi:ATP-binding cassette, subfamily B, bacterial
MIELRESSTPDDDTPPPGVSAKRRPIPYVQQMQTTDCGAACLAMVLRSWKRHEPLTEVRDRLGGARGGVSAQQILEAAQGYGMRGRVARIELDELECLDSGAILHWGMDHFVVLHHVGGKSLYVVDPRLGRRRVPWEEVGRKFTGVAVLLEPTDAFETRQRSHGRILDYLRTLLSHSGTFGRAILLAVLLQGAALTLPLMTGTIVDRVVPEHDVELLRIILFGIVFVGIFSFLTTTVRSLLLMYLRTKLDLKLTFDFVEHLMRLPFSFFQNRQTGDLMMRLGSNSQIRSILTSTLLSGLLDSFMVVTYLILLTVVNWRFAAAVLVLGVSRIAIFVATRRRYQELMTESLRASADASSYQVQMLHGIEVLKASGVERRALDLWSNLYYEVMNISIRQGRLSAFVDAALAAVGLGSPLLLLGYGTYLVLQGDLTLGTMLAVNALAAGFLGPLSSLVSSGLQLLTMGSYIERVEDVLAEKPEQEKDAGLPAPKLTGAIELDRVSFRHSDASPWVLRDVSIRIPARGRIAIVGPSGSGKSTLARLLVQLYRPTTGAIRVDGHDPASFDLSSVRRQIAYVPQTMFLFSGSVRQNIALARPDANLSEVEEAARQAEIHEDILGMSMGYDTRLSEGDGSIAGGQRQRLALARALITEPSVLVMDEATSHLDAATEARIIDNLKHVHATQIVMAHRLSTIRDADLILVLRHGQVVERGSHEELMRLEGAYHDLFQLQMQGVPG